MNSPSGWSKWLARSPGVPHRSSSCSLVSSRQTKIWCLTNKLSSLSVAEADAAIQTAQQPVLTTRQRRCSSQLFSVRLAYIGGNPSKNKAIRVQTGRRQGRQQSRSRPGIGSTRNASRSNRRDQMGSRVRNRRGARVGDQRDRLPRHQPAAQSRPNDAARCARARSTPGSKCRNAAAGSRVRRVSSAATRSTALRIFRARSVMSSRLPIGVATTYNVPARVAAVGPGMALKF